MPAAASWFGIYRAGSQRPNTDDSPPGGVTREELQKVLGEVEVDQPAPHQAPKAPGMKIPALCPNGELC